MEDLSNKTYGDWTVLTFVGTNKNRQAIWHCKCTCGEEQDVLATYLKTGKSRHCKQCGNKNKQNSFYKNLYYKENLLNQKFGKLTVIEETSQRNKNKEILWRCLCDCGGEKNVSTSDLKRGYVTSCGCIVSKGEELITSILNSNNISFETQKTFFNCVFPNTKSLARFDFYINNQYLIEFDGEQHFYPVDFSCNKSEEQKQLDFQLNQIRDSYKNQWCKDNNIPLIRIPYTHYKDLCLEDLLLETSKFII